MRTKEWAHRIKTQTGVRSKVGTFDQGKFEFRVKLLELFTTNKIPFLTKNRVSPLTHTETYVLPGKLSGDVTFCVDSIASSLIFLNHSRIYCIFQIYRHSRVAFQALPKVCATSDELDFLVLSALDFKSTTARWVCSRFCSVAC